MIRNFILINDKPGGAEGVMKILCSHYISLGDKVNVFFLTKKSSVFWEDLENNNQVDLIYSLNLYFLRELISAAKQSNIYTTHVYVTGLIGFFKKLKLIDPNFIIARESTSIFKRYNGLKLKSYILSYTLGYPYIDLLICQTNQMKRDFISNVKKSNASYKIVFIPNPFEYSYALSNNFDSELIGDPFIVTAGRLIDEKGFDVLLKSFKLVKNKISGLKLIILGDGHLRNDLLSCAKQLGLEDSVVMPGFVNNVLEYFSKAEMCVISSRIEGFPNVLLQMMSQNNNVVSTLCAGGIEQINGIYKSKTDDSFALANAMEACYINNNDNCRDLFSIELNSRSIEKFAYNIDSHLA